MKVSFVLVLLALLAVSAFVSAQKAYPAEQTVTLIGQPSVNTRDFAVDLPASAILLARTDSADDEEEEAHEEVSMEEMTDSESTLTSGDILAATTTLNVRSGACTDRSIVRKLSPNEQVRFNGDVRSGCGYTWYGVSGSWGSGFAASAYLTPVGGGGGNGCRQSYNYPLFKQCDGRWGSDRLGSSTVCAIGCLMTSVTSALNGRGKSSMNPGQMNSWLKSNGGYYGDLFVWGSVSRFGFSYLGQTQDKATIRNWLCSGKVVILNVRNGGHWVLAKSYSNGVYEVNDSGFSVSSYTESQVVRAAAFSA
ncbi:hypothetical protein FDP41_008091 [Naegleria fowleri]|uniref:Peptidase C39-like domain-containing protein n=1 Tax=Naegleria fowleri TaxID=5763 RepID=A0A6A5B737_NAEFO|nr:uncharacterized protein FDP41_008091 [Naegleria fowleri]KAF0973387.1 hypothetical protein FDP41_008091 [Naegleria fowleri]